MSSLKFILLLFVILSSSSSIAMDFSRSCDVTCESAKCFFECQLSSSNSKIKFGTQFQDFNVISEVTRFRVLELNQLQSAVRELQEVSPKFYYEVMESSRQGWWAIYQVMDKKTWQALRLVRWKDEDNRNFNVFFLPKSQQPLTSIFDDFNAKKN